VTTADTFAALLAGPGRALLACDYDGTLAAIVSDPALARPRPGAVEALAALASRLGMVAVVTGRPAADAVQVGGLERVPGLVVLGLYGAQRWADGSMQVSAPVPAGLAEAAEAVDRLLASAPVGVYVEHKGGSLAVHTRRSGNPAQALAALRGPLRELAATTGLRLQGGRYVLELVPAGVDKGVALASLVSELAPACVLYAGDDIADLPAFDVVARLRGAGLPGWRVAAANGEAPEVAAAADVVVGGPDGMVALLAELVALLD
jgi:trehalose 6-phosphate phosphatase